MRSSSTPSIGVAASGQAAAPCVRAVTAPEATPSDSPASAAVKLQMPSLAAMPRRRSLKPRLCVPYSSVTVRSPRARSTTASTFTDGAPCTSILRSDGEIAAPAEVGLEGTQERCDRQRLDRRRHVETAPPPRSSAPCQARRLQRRVAPSASALPGSRLARGARPPRSRCRAGRAPAARCGSGCRGFARPAPAACRSSRRRARCRRRPGRRPGSGEDAAARRRRAAAAARGCGAARRRGRCRRRRSRRHRDRRGARAHRRDRIDPLRRQRGRLDPQLEPMRARRAAELAAHPLDRPPGEVDAVERERAVGRRIGGAADAPAAFAATHGEAAEAQPRRLQLAFAAQVGPAPFDARARDQGAGERRGRARSCRGRPAAVRPRPGRAPGGRLQQRREPLELRRIERAAARRRRRGSARSGPRRAGGCRWRRGRAWPRALPSLLA